MLSACGARGFLIKRCVGATCSAARSEHGGDRAESAMLGVTWAVSRALGAAHLAYRIAIYKVAGLWRYAEDYGWPVLIGCMAFASFSTRVRNALHQRRAERRFVRAE